MTRENLNILAAVAPFATWIALQTLLPATAGAYAVRSVATFGVLLAVLPRLRRICPLGAGTLRAGFAQVAWGLLGGLLVLALWTLPEASVFYRTWFVWPLGSLPAEAAAPSPYSPAVCGWPLTLAKLVGSAFVIAPVEEVFFRSFLYRWLQRHDLSPYPLRASTSPPSSGPSPSSRLNTTVRSPPPSADSSTAFSSSAAVSSPPSPPT